MFSRAPALSHWQPPRRHAKEKLKIRATDPAREPSRRDRFGSEPRRVTRGFDDSSEASTVHAASAGDWADKDTRRAESGADASSASSAAASSAHGTSWSLPARGMPLRQSGATPRSRLRLTNSSRGSAASFGGSGDAAIAFPPGEKKTACPFASLNTRTPSSCTSRWCLPHKRSVFFRLVSPPSAQCSIW